MSMTFEETFEYRHKKFNYGKRSRTDSNSSSDSEDYECKQMEIEKLNERLQTPHDMETEPSVFPLYKEEYVTSSPPPSKRQRTSSFSDSSYSSSYSPIPFNRLRTSTTPLSAIETTIPPAAAILPKISDETLRNICKYHGNMVRKYPKKERTPKDQERRNKNTIACRLSRRVKKLEHVAIEEQYKEFSEKTFSIIEQAMRSTAYLHKLIELANESKNEKMLEASKPNAVSSPDKKPFTIEYLIGKKD